jgi:hypothetical protein
MLCDPSSDACHLVIRWWNKNDSLSAPACLVSWHLWLLGSQLVSSQRRLENARRGFGTARFLSYLSRERPTGAAASGPPAAPTDLAVLALRRPLPHDTQWLQAWRSQGRPARFRLQHVQQFHLVLDALLGSGQSWWWLLHGSSGQRQRRCFVDWSNNIFFFNTFPHVQFSWTQNLG